MFQKDQRLFLQEKIMELQQALFHSCSESLLKLPVSIIQALHVDDLNQVWFMVRKPMQYLNEFDSAFPAKLHFYRKGKPFYMHVSGKAMIISDPEDLSCLFDLPIDMSEVVKGSMVLVKMKVTETVFYPSKVCREATQKVKLFTLPQPSAFVKTLQYIVKDIIPVFQSH